MYIDCETRKLSHSGRSAMSIELRERIIIVQLNGACASVPARWSIDIVGRLGPQPGICECISFGHRNVNHLELLTFGTPATSDLIFKNDGHHE
jgi:hypothetical protein